jgi:hypothetical protein
MKAKLSVISLVLLLLALSGCAKTVTPLVNYGEQLLVTVTLRGTADPSNNRYFLVLSADPNYRLPLPPPNQLSLAPEFIEPEMTPVTGSREAYFTNFFNSWSGYLIMEPLGFTLVKGPFSTSQTPTREVQQGLGTLSNTLTFSFRLGKLWATVPDKIYFDVVTVPWPSGLEKVPADHLPTTNNNISKLSGSIVVVDDLQDPGVDVGLDIINCRLEVQ